jgi:hypothetical protein
MISTYYRYCLSCSFRVMMIGKLVKIEHHTMGRSGMLKYNQMHSRGSDQVQPGVVQ